MSWTDKLNSAEVINGVFAQITITFSDDKDASRTFNSVTDSKGNTWQKFADSGPRGKRITRWRALQEKLK